MYEIETDIAGLWYQATFISKKYIRNEDDFLSR